LRRIQAAADDHAVFVDGLMDDLGLPQRQQLAHARVTGLFDDHADRRVRQQLGQQEQSVLLADGDQDLVGVGHDAAPRQHLGADLLDQLRIVGIALGEVAFLHDARAEGEPVRLAPLRGGVE
jgi:hypothetical protein